MRRQRRKTNGSRGIFLRADFSPPASVIVLAVSRQAGANAVEVARSVTRPHCRNCASNFPARSTSSRPSIARQSSCIRLHDVQATLMIAFVPRDHGHLRFSRTRDATPSFPWSRCRCRSSSLSSRCGRSNYSINNLTLMALTLAIGFLVDDAIVFLENVVRRAEARRIDLPRHTQQRGRNFLHHSVHDACRSRRSSFRSPSCRDC